MLPRALSLVVLLAVLPLCAQEPPEFARPSENLADGASYTLSPNPSYALCRDDGDATQLTDGEYTSGYFWTQPTTVGWGAAHEPLIAIDLGQPRAIRGLSYHTAAGRAGVSWPRSIALFVSDDGQRWHGIGDLVVLDRQRGGAPAVDDYTTYRFWTDALRTHGRYVALAIQPTGTYTFVDEVEVYAGDAAWLAQPLTGPAMDGLEAARMRRRAVADVEAQIEQLRQQIAGLPAAQQPALTAALDRAADGLARLTPPAGDRAVPPYGPAHQAVLDVHAAIGRAQGRPPLTLWRNNKWDPIEMLDTADTAEPPPLDFAMLRGEVRGDVVNISSCADRNVTLTIAVDGLPAEAVTLRQALWTAVRDAPPMASALPELSGPWIIEPGLTRQLWVEVDSHALPAGAYEGRLRIAIASDGGPTGDRVVPLTVHVAALSLPEQPSLALGGWDYTNSPHRGVTEQNVDQVVEFLRGYDLDAPWATSSAMPFGKHAADGAMTEPPSTANMDAWLDRWPGAKYYCVFVATSENIDAQPSGPRRVGEWIRFWADHLRTRDIDPAKLVLLIVDETRTVEQDAIIVAWSKAIKKVAPEVRIFNDPIWVDPRDATGAMYEASDFLCPNRVRWLEQPEAYEAVFLTQQAAGRQLMFYSCSGPVRRLDPYSYHLLQAWEAYRVGAVATMFWAFGDSGGGTAWNEFATPGVVYSPQMLGPEGSVTTKHMEAIREGRQDYDYLVMLRSAIAAADAAGQRGALLDGAKKLMAEAPSRVLGKPDPASITWQREADRGESERVRREILEVLERLAG